MKSKKSKGGGGTKLPSGLASKMKAAKPAQQEVPNVGLSAFGRRRKSKMKGL